VSFAFKATLTGLEDAVSALYGMRRTFRNKVLRKALRAGAKPLIKLARGFVRVKTGTYKRSIGVAITTDKGGRVEARIAARQKGTVIVDGVRVNPVYYSHLEEEGRAAIDQKSKVLTDLGRGANDPSFFGAHVAAEVGSHAFRRAFDQGKGIAVAEVGRVIAEELAKARGKDLAA
jgi:hypothetical protein